MKKSIPLDKNLVVKMMNMFDAKAIAFSSEKELRKPEVRAKLIAQAVDEALALKSETYLSRREEYIQVVTSSLFKENTIKEVGEGKYLEIIRGAKEAEHRLPHDNDVGMRRK